jgi:uncharacterized Fe-S cluster-containing radical SAM superfamily enzyme
MPKLIGKTNDKYYLFLDDIPLIGHIAFGVIDRATNIIQVRPTTICPLNCIFCSVDAGPFSRYRQSEYIVDSNLLVKWVRKVVDIKKGEVIEALIDGVGDPMSYQWIDRLVENLKSFIPRVAIETHGYNLTKALVKSLERVGLDRINLSIDTLDAEKARMLQGASWYDVKRVKEVAEFIVKETSIDLHITPVWIPGINDNDINDIIEWGLSIGIGKRFPPFGIQKYEVHKYGRRIPHVKSPSWREFRIFLENLEKKYGIDLYYKKLDFDIHRTRHRVEPRYSINDVVKVYISSPGWLKGEAIAVDESGETVITIVNVKDMKIVGKRAKVKIIKNSNSIYIARLI